MMNLVFHHRAQPFPHGDGRAVGGETLFLQIIRRELSDNRYGFFVHPFEIREHVGVDQWYQNKDGCFTVRNGSASKPTLRK